jgi:hypothetical protein
MSYLEHYKKYRGKCREMCESLIIERPDYVLVRGHYFEPAWDTSEAHWWCVDTNGTIQDPSALQFPSGGIAEYYTEYDGFTDCEECGKRTAEADLILLGNGNHPVCSNECACRLLGV